MSYIVKTIGEKVVLGVLLTKENVALTGLSPTLEIRRNVDGWYLDFAATSAPYWKTTGGQKELVLPEKTWLPGYYTWTFDHAVYDGVKNDYTAVYRNDAPYRLLELEVLSFNNESAFDIKRILRHLENDQDLEALATDHFEHRVYEDDGVTVMHAADIQLDGQTEKRRKL